ncbi:MAG: hypothetical protein JW891_06985 [Candidatus Lokiarchaeota archaeon]|nr:hypothetical protein [Candidatus Lokiarchaeota archaeon]
MIIKEFYNRELDLEYSVGINCIRIDFKNFLNKFNIKNQKNALNHLFNLCKDLEGPNDKTTVQFFKDKYLLCQDHFFIACYHVIKAFASGINISNSKNLELLLYLSSNRQINQAVEAFGIENDDLIAGKLSYCIISESGYIVDKNKELTDLIDAEELDFPFKYDDVEKIDEIKHYFEVTDKQIKVVLNSYERVKRKDKSDLEIKSMALYDLICEKMSLLNIEKTSGN